MPQRLTDSILRSTVTIATDAIICVDGNQRITFFNEGASHIFGYTAQEVAGQPLEMLLPARFGSVHHRHVERFGSGGIPARTMGERRQIAGLRKDGTEFPAEAAIAHVDTADGPAYSVVLRDVTERRRIEAENSKLVKDLQSAIVARDEMLGIVSHDLRNPVNAVKMLSTALLRLGESQGISGDVLDHARTMGKAAEQMDALIQDLLDVTRIESGRLRLNPQAVPIESVVGSALETLAPIAAEQQVNLSAELTAPVPPLFVDPDRMMQVLSNLIGNAIKHTPRDGRVTVSALREHDDVRISVVDTGIGIAADELPRVFDRFWQSRRTNRSGAGLGLTIVRGIVRGHGGRIWIESELGKGTSVHFTVPTASDPIQSSPDLATSPGRGTGAE